MRVVSLLASATEIVCALEAGEQLVGRSHECDNPPWVRRLPQLSEPAFDTSLSSGDINREVSRRLRVGEPLYRVHTQRIRELKPDLILAQSHCEVCAITPGDIERNDACIPGAQIVSLSAGSMEEIFASIMQVSAALGRQDKGTALVARERARLDRLRRKTSSLRHPSVVVLEWTDPFFAMSNWGPELIEAAGGDLTLGKRGEYSTAIPAEQLKAVDPEYIVVAPCGFTLERTLLEAPVLERLAWWPELRAVRNGKVAFADGNLFFNRSGMTVVRSAEILAEIFHGIITENATEKQSWLWLGGALLSTPHILALANSEN
jgi:iron complex transport system substrate-binding protein